MTMTKKEKAEAMKPRLATAKSKSQEKRLNYQTDPKATASRAADAMEDVPAEPVADFDPAGRFSPPSGGFRPYDQAIEALQRIRDSKLGCVCGSLDQSQRTEPIQNGPILHSVDCHYIIAWAVLANMGI